MNRSGSAPRQGIGLENTRARLFQLHGDRSALRLEDAEGGGVRSVLELPLRPAPSAAAPHRPASHALVTDG
jgi:sensor histidine kinase YesM